MRSIGGIAGALIGLVLLAGGYVYVSIGVRPSGPYGPLAHTEYFFDKEGATRELGFKPVFLRNHEVALLSSRQFPVDLPMGCRLRAEVYRFGIKIDERILSEGRRSVFGKGLQFSDEISFGWVPVLDGIPGSARVILTVLVPQRAKPIYRDAFSIVVRPSPIR